jgi:hypothetical protein
MLGGLHALYSPSICFAHVFFAVSEIPTHADTLSKKILKTKSNLIYFRRSYYIAIYQQRRRNATYSIALCGKRGERQIVIAQIFTNFSFKSPQYQSCLVI